VGYKILKYQADIKITQKEDFSRGKLGLQQRGGNRSKTG
jgi:hypothetical protein